MRISETLSPASTPRATYVGLFLITLSTLALQILLTRIFNVTLMYHYAFVAVSITMFGMTIGAITVYLRPQLFDGHVPERLAQCALITGIAAVTATTIHVQIPFDPGLSTYTALYLTGTVALFITPFIASGVCVTLVLTRHAHDIGRLYAADLVGAAAGCIAIIGIMQLAGAIGGVITVALLTCIAAYCFASVIPRTRRGLTAMTTLALGALFAITLGAALDNYSNQSSVKDPAGTEETIFEKWTALSRVLVEKLGGKPFGWGFSSTASLDRFRPEQLMLTMDTVAGTVLTRYGGDPKTVDYLKYDVVNFAHHLRPDSDVLVVGVGGGRDILSALAFDQKSVVGIEMNPTILDLLTHGLADYTGNLAQDPRVRLVNDEARSYIARHKQRYDIIQISLIDTWAATAAGAFVFSENTLYTREAWATFLSRLRDRGVLSVSRWYFDENPAEMYRMVSLATAALRDIGVDQPRAHLAALRSLGRTGKSAKPFPNGVGTLLVSRSPFTANDIQRVQQLGGQLGFELILTPNYAKDETVRVLANGNADDTFLGALPANVTAPTDDNPFFFNMLRFRDMLDTSRWSVGIVSFNMKAVFLLGTVFLITLLMTTLCIAVPWLATPDKNLVRRHAPQLAFFAAIGLGFMLIEIAQMQRLMVFLGHPLYGLSVILFALLVGGGSGSYLTSKIAPRLRVSATPYLFLALLLVVTTAGALTYPTIEAFRSASTLLRIVVALALVAPLGLVLGMAFPLGMRVAHERAPRITPWLWGVNGAMSVLASVGAVVVSLAYGIAATYWTGVACYVVATGSYVLMLRAQTVTNTSAQPDLGNAPWGRPVLHTDSDVG